MSDNLPAERVDHLPVAGTASPLLAAIEKGLDAETIERLVSLQNQQDDREAARSFSRALAAFQAACPAIPKTKEVGTGSYTYKYAPLGVIADTIRDTIRDCGLSYSWDTDTTDGALRVTCTLRHEDGHSIESHFLAPIDRGAKMNDTQKSGSAMSYGQRYSLSQVLGITTCDDDDGQSTGERKQPERKPPSKPPSKPLRTAKPWRSASTSPNRSLPRPSPTPFNLPRPTKRKTSPARSNPADEPAWISLSQHKPKKSVETSA